MSESNSYTLYTYRYMWTVKGVNDKCNIKIVTDVPDGHARFIEDIKSRTPDLENFGREYVNEFDLSKLGVFEDIIKI